MYTGWVWGITMLVVGAIVALTAIQVVAAAMFPHAAEAARRRVAAGRSANVAGTCAGVVAVLAAVAAVAAVAQVPKAGPLLALVIGSAASMALATGLAGVSAEIGRRMAGERAPGDVPWRRVVRGAVAAELAGLVPFVGWALLVFVWIPAGAGAFVMSRIRPVAAPQAEAAA